jgi:hypothetical protein
VSDTRTILKGWTDIADYLEVSVRTAQAYHRRLQLPIQHYSKALICADSKDLDTWKVTRLTTTLERFAVEATQRKDDPPLKASFLFYLLMTPQNCDALVGDLEERYSLIRKKFGRSRATFWYWFQTFISLRPIVCEAVKKTLMKPLIGVAAWGVGRGLISHDGWIAALVELWKKIAGA